MSKKPTPYTPTAKEQAEWAKAPYTWWCDKCCVSVYDRRCVHCGKLERDKA